MMVEQHLNRHAVRAIDRSGCDEQGIEASQPPNNDFGADAVCEIQIANGTYERQAINFREDHFPLAFAKTSDLSNDEVCHDIY